MRYSKGFSLVELMVVCGIMGIIAMAGISALQSSIQAGSFSEDRTARNLLTQSTQAILDEYSACANTLSGLTLSNVGLNVPLAEIRDRSNTVVYSNTAPNNIYEKLLISSIRVRNIDIPLGTTSGRISVQYVLTRTRTGIGTTQLLTVPIEKRVIVSSATHQIQACANTKEDSLFLRFGSVGNTLISDFSERTVLTFSVNRLATRGQISVSLPIGGSDIVWANIRLYRGSTMICFWPDGTSHQFGAAIHTSRNCYDNSLSPGNTTYRVTFQRLSHPSYGTLSTNINAVEAIFRQ